MELPVEGFSVVAKLEHIQALLDNNVFEVPNSTALNDKHIWKCSFMAEEDARDFLEELAKLDLNVSPVVMRWHHVDSQVEDGRRVAVTSRFV